MNLPDLNTELLSDIVTWAWADDCRLSGFMAEHFPDWGQWNQGAWAKEVRNGVCQTAYCIAGQTAVQSGYALNHYEDPYALNPNGKTFYADSCYPVKKSGKDDKGKQRYRRAGSDIDISDVARIKLGLTDDEARALFEGDNRMPQIVWLAMEFARVRGVELNLHPDVVAVADTYRSEDIEEYVFDYGDYDGVVREELVAA